MFLYNHLQGHAVFFFHLRKHFRISWWVKDPVQQNKGEEGGKKWIRRSFFGEGGCIFWNFPMSPPHWANPIPCWHSVYRRKEGRPRGEEGVLKGKRIRRGTERIGQVGGGRRLTGVVGKKSGKLQTRREHLASMNTKPWRKVCNSSQTDTWSLWVFSYYRPLFVSTSQASRRLSTHTPNAPQCPLLAAPRRRPFAESQWAAQRAEAFHFWRY